LTIKRGKISDSPNLHIYTNGQMIYITKKAEHPIRENFLKGLHLILLLFVPIYLSGQESGQGIQSSKPDSVRTNRSISPSDKAIGTLDEYVKINQEQPSEKIFLHPDRYNYLQGDTIWFKAYSWYGYEQIPDTVSGILYVDLISPEGRIYTKRRLLIQNGTSHGDFCLDTTIRPGRYALRAYTRLMQNSGSGNPYYQSITVNAVRQNFQFECTPLIIKQFRNDSLRIGFRFFETDQSGSFKNNFSHQIRYTLKIGDHLIQTDSIFLLNTQERILKYSLNGTSSNDSIAQFDISINDDQLTFKKEINIPLRENIDLQFFPEGGNLINGLVSKVAFKAIGTDGLGKELTGEIRSVDDTVITVFKSSHKGMGSFLLKPVSGRKYSAHFWYNNQKYIVPLPQAALNGTIMAVSHGAGQSERLLSIMKVPGDVSTQKYVIGSAYGKIWFSALLKSFIDSCSLKIPSELMPEGVCRLTILNSAFEPECERLVYINKNQRFKIKVIPDSSSYAERSKVTLVIKTTDQDGYPVQADLSIAVTDNEQNRNEVNVHGINACRLLESELRGQIEDADYYFRSDSLTNLNDLDLLLLTQGYRKFILNSTKPEELKSDPEKSFLISGILKFNGSKLREQKLNYHDINLSVISVSEKPYAGHFNPDSLGNFRFQIPLLSGRQHLILQATTAKKKPFDCDIFLDKPSAVPQFASIPQLKFNTLSPVVKFLPSIQAIQKPHNFGIPVYGLMTKTLGEVVVTAKVNSKNWWRNYEKDALKIADLDSLDPDGNRYKDIYDLLIREFGAREFRYNNLRTILLPAINMPNPSASYISPIYVIDGKIYPYFGPEYTELNTLSVFPVDEIKNIGVIPPAATTAIHYGDPVSMAYGIFQSMVVIETYSKNTYRGDLQGIKKFIFDGLDVPRIFYSPRYDGQLRSSQLYDNRATLYWEPALRTDSNGQAKAEFFTSDRQTGLEVILNGIDVIYGYPGETHFILNPKRNIFNFKDSH
jgi:hypothetical protein